MVKLQLELSALFSSSHLTTTTVTVVQLRTRTKQFLTMHAPVALYKRNYVYKQKLRKKQARILSFKAEPLCSFFFFFVNTDQLTRSHDENMKPGSKYIYFFKTYGLKSKQGVTHMDSHDSSSETTNRGGTRSEVLEPESTTQAKKSPTTKTASKPKINKNNCCNKLAFFNFETGEPLSHL